jgi:hypothetical protein
MRLAYLLPFRKIGIFVPILMHFAQEIRGENLEKTRKFLSRDIS